MQDIELNYGASFIRERTGPSKGKWEYAVNREGERKEGHLFLNGSYMLAGRLTLMGGWDYKSYQVEDYSPVPSLRRKLLYMPNIPMRHAFHQWLKVFVAT